MSKPNRTLSARFKKFNGVNIPDCHSGDEVMREIENFHIESDGSLKKRNGYKHFFHFDGGEIGTVWSGRIKGEFKCYLTVGSYLYSFDPSSRTYTAVGMISESSSTVSFFFLNDVLYIKDDQTIYTVGDTSLTPIHGYIPLYGKDWGTSYPGKVFQPINLLHKKVRISYLIGSPHTAMLATQYPVKRILSVYRNGTKLNEDEYVLDKNFNTVNIQSGVVTGERYVVCVEYESMPEPEAEYFAKCQHSKVINESEAQMIAVWGSPNDKSCLYISPYISQEDFDASEQEVEGAGKFYFTTKSSIKTGDGSKEITSVLKSREKLLIFSEKDLWTANEESLKAGSLSITNLNPAFGCSSFYGSVMAQNDPITVSSSGIMRWSASDPDEVGILAQSISEKVNTDLGESFFKSARAYSNVENNQLWFLEPRSGGVAWIYDLGQRSWVKYTGLQNAVGFFELDGKTAFFSESDFYVFSSDLPYDIDASGNEIPITATAKSGSLDFGSNEYKRLIGCELAADLCGEELELCISCDSKEKINVSPSSESEHSVFNIRTRSGRFLNLTLSLASRGKSSQVIHGITLKAKEKIKGMKG